MKIANEIKIFCLSDNFHVEGTLTQRKGGYCQIFKIAIKVPNKKVSTKQTKIQATYCYLMNMFREMNQIDECYFLKLNRLLCGTYNQKKINEIEKECHHHDQIERQTCLLFNKLNDYAKMDIHLHFASLRWRSCLFVDTCLFTQLFDLILYEHCNL